MEEVRRAAPVRVCAFWSPASFVLDREWRSRTESAGRDREITD